MIGPAGRFAGIAAGAAGIGLYAALALTSMRAKSATFDEGAHLPAGYTYLARRDHRLNPEHPPLVKLLAAAPLLALGDGVRLRADDEAWTQRRQWEFGKRFLYRWNDAERLLFLGRLPVVALGCALCLAVFVEARRRFGLAAAALALLLAATSPDLLAHGQIVTTDVGIALFLFLSVLSFDRLLARPSSPRVVAAGLAAGAAFATKFSAVVLLPVFVLLLSLRLREAGPPVELGAAPPATGTRRRRLVMLAGRLAAVAMIALALVWACYGFDGSISRDPEVEAGVDWTRVQPARALPRAAAQMVRASGLLPEAYVYGFLRFFRHSEARPTFLLGELSDHGFWYYFPVTFALKTPLGLVGLLIVAACTGRWAGHRRVLILPVLVYVVLALMRTLNIGHRHLLPIYPFLFVLAGRSAAWALGASRRRTGGVLVVALAAWAAVSSLRIHPHYLAYFNELGGGSANGYKRLVDSNLDWGQDLAGLAAWSAARGVTRFKLSYFGSADPVYYHLPVELLPGHSLPPQREAVWHVEPGDILAVSATNLQAVYLDRGARPLMALLREREPIAHVGHSILIYRADFRWTGTPAGAPRAADDER